MHRHPEHQEQELFTTVYTFTVEISMQIHKGCVSCCVNTCNMVLTQLCMKSGQIAEDYETISKFFRKASVGE